MKYWYWFNLLFLDLNWPLMQFRMKARMDLMWEWHHENQGNVRFDFRFSNGKCHLICYFPIGIVLNIQQMYQKQVLRASRSISRDHKLHFVAGAWKRLTSLIVWNFGSSRSIFATICQLVV